MDTGNIPIISVKGRTLAEAWEKAVLETWNKGLAIKTEYDKKEDPPSRDCTMIMVVDDPFAEPRIHRAFPAGLEELEIYRQEVVEGIHDHWISPEQGKWTYTYHERLFGYEVEGTEINQIDYIVNKLAQTPYSRRAQAITWNPKIDPPTYDPPCLQRCWFRLSRNEHKRLLLNMNTHWRSRDGFKAAFMNIFALTDLQKLVAARISKKIHEQVIVGRYADITDSFHIYGSYFEQFQDFLNTVKNRSFQERTWTSEFCEPFFEEGKRRLKDERDKEQSAGGRT